MAQPQLSIIIPLYNKEKQIARAIDSILSQCYDHRVEIVVVDDGSTDDSAGVVASVKDDRLHYYYQSNQGVSAARNAGIKMSQGEWLIFLDADDRLLPDALSCVLSLIGKYPGERIIVGQVENDCMPQYRCRPSRVTLCRHPYRSLWLGAFYPHPGSVAIHRTLVEQYGGFDERMSFFEDYEFALRVLQYGSVVCTPQVLSAYYQEPRGLASSRHLPEKEMAYYIPEMNYKDFFARALLYENIEFSLLCWREDPEVSAFYQQMKEKTFSRVYDALHWLRQKLINHHWL